MKEVFRTIRKKSIMTAAGFLAVASVGNAACEGNEPQPTALPTVPPVVSEYKAPVPTTELVIRPGYTPLPEPTPTIVPPTDEPTAHPRPTPTKTPEPTPTPTPELTPTHTPTPEPTPTIEPTPTKVPKTFLKPGQSLAWSELIQNPISETKKRSIDFVFRGGDRQQIIAKIRIPTISNDPISEGSTFNMPHSGTFVFITIDIPPGASPTCFDEILYNVKSQEEGSWGNLIDQTLLAQNICVDETIFAYFSPRLYNDQKRLQISDLLIQNTADVKQKIRFVIQNCNPEVSEQTILAAKNILQDKKLEIPPKSSFLFEVRQLLDPRDDYLEHFSCEVNIQKELEK